MTQTSIVSDDVFQNLYETYYARVFAFACSRVDNAELAKDIAAEVFERAYLKGNDVRKMEAYGGWLFAIAKNVITSHYRRRRREDDLLDRMRDSLRLVSWSDSPEDHMIKSEWAGRLISRVRLLPRRDQELLSLKFDAELKNADIARVMGMSEGNVRISVYRAVKRLRRQIADESGEMLPIGQDGSQLPEGNVDPPRRGGRAQRASLARTSLVRRA
jgi:RNA polymerase sigma factor (sigma-70 family)